MASKSTNRLLVITIVVILLIDCAKLEFVIPPMTIEAYKPQGLRIKFKDNKLEKIQHFEFHGNLNKPIGPHERGDIYGLARYPSLGWWVIFKVDVVVAVGDVVNYRASIGHNNRVYTADNLTHVITEFQDPFRSKTDANAGSGQNCTPTVTKVLGTTACSGQIIFEDTFEFLKENVWQIHKYFPKYHPEYPFVSYQRHTSDYEPTVMANQSYLYIKPSLRENTDNFIYSGQLNLFRGCTAAAEACEWQASGADIVPPVVSGRVTSKSFAFTYGTVHVRAKLPQGDWLYPEILLEPYTKRYGSQPYSSGVIKIATARGNKELSQGSTDYSNRVLYGGAIMDFRCRKTLLWNKTNRKGRTWSDDFHVYSVRWAPDSIILFVDGEEWARVEPTASGLGGRYPRECAKLPRALLALGSRLAPFDDYITLGVAAGGVTEFPDGTTTGGTRPKPWDNRGRKASLYFLRDLDAWYPTWTQPELIVDYVKVVAL